VRAVRVLLLGGSTEASALARELTRSERFDVTMSFAGRTRERTAVPCAVRVGGFGGVDGLVRHLRHERVDMLVDATHPFAAHMPHHAAAACATTGTARLRVCRPAWSPVDDDRWEPVADLDAAADALVRIGSRRVFLTTGRQELAPFARARDTWFLVRAIEPPASMPLAHSHVVLARGPFDERDEERLMREHRVDTLVTKNSGGDAAAGKLAAARTLRLPVVMVDRPAAPDGPRADGVADALVWIAARADEVQSAAG
jgi:precorrin-6A/cobalt-precorrin-6A reductase